MTKEDSTKHRPKSPFANIRLSTKQTKFNKDGKLLSQDKINLTSKVKTDGVY